MIIGIPMKGLRRNDDAMKNRSLYQNIIRKNLFFRLTGDYHLYFHRNTMHRSGNFFYQ